MGQERVDDVADSRNATQLAVWESAGLLLTYWCNSRCACCYVYGGPERDGEVDPATAVAWWRSLDRLAATHGRTMRIHLAGGEPFRDWPRLASIVRAARDAGLTRLEKVETNAFWATSEGLVRARLELLDALGLEKLVVSTDIYHQEHVPFERVRCCIETARRVLGRSRVQARWWDFYQNPVDLRQMAPAERDDTIRAALARHAERLTGRAAECLAPLLPCRPAEAYRGQSCAEALLRSRHVHIDPCGNVFPGTCAGIILGRVGTRTVDELWHELAARWQEHPIASMLVAGGSHALYEQARARGYVERPGGYADKCHLCTHVRRFLVEQGVWRAFLGPPECYGAMASARPNNRVDGTNTVTGACGVPATHGAVSWSISRSSADTKGG